MTKKNFPKLAMLKRDGSSLRPLETPSNDAPNPTFGTRDGSGKGAAVYIAASQVLPEGHSIIGVQNKTTLSLLEMNEVGAITAISIKLPEGMKIDGIIASDQHLYARVASADDGSIYEIGAHDGTVMRRFILSDGRPASGVASVCDGKSLWFEHGDGKLIPLIDTEPAVSAEKQNKASSPTN
jgi:hypothetical protein